MILEKAIEDFLLGQPKPSTRKTYKGCLIPMQKHVGETKDITEVDPSDIIRYSATLYDKGYAQATIRKHIITIKTFFNFYVDLGTITVSPSKKLKTPKRNTDTREKAMTDKEFDTMVKWAKQTSPRNYAMLLFFGDTGCREIALRRLKISDLNLDERYAIITGKGDKTRTVYFGETCQKALRYWLRVKPINTTQYVFRQRVNSDITTGELKESSLSQILRKISRDAGLRTLSSHSLRHRKGHQLADSGTPITVAAKVLGHENTQTTEVYYPNDDERVRKVMEKLAHDHVPNAEKAIPNEETKQPTIIQFPSHKNA